MGGNRVKIKIDDKEWIVLEIAKATGMSRQAIHSRIIRGFKREAKKT